MSVSDQARFGAVVYAKDVSRISAFYAAVLGVDVAHHEDDHVILESPGCQLVVQAIPTSIAQSIVVNSPPTRRRDTPLKLVFPVDSITRVRAVADDLGGQIDSSEHEWHFQQDRVCDGCDPEGNVIQLRERQP